jgi:glutathione peroxidase-family protein
MPSEYLLYDPKNSRDIKWNYEKFLINPKTGEAFRRYDTLYDLSKIADDIKQLV